MNPKIRKIITGLEPYKGVLYFLVLLFFFHFSWKIAIDGDIDSTQMYIFGKDVTPDWFHSVCLWLTKASAWVTRLLPGGDALIVNGTRLFFPNGGIIINIIWGCTGIKQMFIFSCIMLFYRGPFLKKLWYIPMGCFILTLYNIVRIGLITYFTNGHPELFDSLHNGIFRYIYYGIIFLLWVIWEEFIVKKSQYDKQRQDQTAT